MMQYDVIANNGVLAPSRREAIIDPTVGANHNDNKPAHGKTFLTRTIQAQIRCAGLISTLTAHYSLRKALHSSATLFSKDGRICNVLSSPFSMHFNKESTIVTKLKMYTDRQTDGRTDGCTQMHGRTDCQTVRETGRHADTGRRMDEQTDGCMH